MSPKENPTEDALLAALGAHVREEQSSDDVALPPGTPPFDEAAVARITARLLSVDLGTTASPAPPAPSSASQGEKGAEGKVIPLPERRPTSAAARFWWAAPALAAASVMLWMGTRGPSDVMPAYEMSVVSAKASRAMGTSPQHAPRGHADPNGDFELVRTPATPTTNVAARAVLVRQGTPRSWTPPIDVSSEGAVRNPRNDAGALPETRGTVRKIVVLVGAKWFVSQWRGRAGLGEHDAGPASHPHVRAFRGSAVSRRNRANEIANRTLRPTLGATKPWRANVRRTK